VCRFRPGRILAATDNREHCVTSVVGNDREGAWIAVLLSPKQVAILLGISSRQVLRLPIPQIRLGPKTIRYRKEDVNAFVKESTRGN
jgi:hypothetical protein